MEMPMSHCYQIMLTPLPFICSPPVSHKKVNNFDIRTCDWYKGAMVHATSPGYMYLLHSIFSLMSSYSSSPSLKSSNSAATWKCKYKALQVEHASTYSRKLKRWGFGSGRSWHFYLLISLDIHSAAETQMSVGRVWSGRLTCSVSQERWWKKMIVEMRWLILRMWISYQLSQCLHVVSLIALPSISENATWRSYHALLHHAPIVKTLVEGGDTYALKALYINVSFLVN